MPSTGDQTAVNTLPRQRRVRMVRQRHKTLAEVEDFLFRDANGTKLMYCPCNIVFKIAIFGRRKTAAHLGPAKVFQVGGWHAKIRLVFVTISSAPKMSLITAAESAPACQICLTLP